MSLKTLLSATLIVAAAQAAHAAPDWAQWRGPARTGIIAESAPLPTNWPATGLTKVWESEKIPTYNDGGLGSVVVADGCAYVYANWKYQDPIATRTLRDDGLRRLGWVPEKPPEELFKAVETARACEERAALKGDPLNKWVDAWLTENLKDEELKKKFRDYARDRLHRGTNAMDWAAIDKLAEIRNKTFATQAELDEWLKGSGLDAKVTAEAVKVIPTTVEKANDVVMSFDAATGEVKWRKEIAAEPRGWDNSGTPLVADGRLYILGSGNRFYCLDVKSGDVVWTGKAEAGSGSSSAALLDGKLIVVAGSLMAFDVKTGDVLWKQPAVAHSHASPAFWVKDGKTYVLCNSNNDLVCVDPADGKLLWKTSPGGHNSTPAIEGDLAVLQGQGSGITGYRLAADKAEKLWNIALNDRGSSPILRDGHAYVLCGSGNAKAMCIKADSGQIVWEEKAPNQEISSPILVGDKLLSFVAGAKELWMIKATPEKFILLAKTKVPGANCSTPTVVGTRLFLRTEKGVGCYELAPAAPEAAK